MRPSLRSTRDVVASVPRPAGAAVRRLVSHAQAQAPHRSGHRGVPVRGLRSLRPPRLRRSACPPRHAAERRAADGHRRPPRGRERERHPDPRDQRADRLRAGGVGARPGRRPRPGDDDDPACRGPRDDDRPAAGARADRFHARARPRAGAARDSRPRPRRCRSRRDPGARQAADDLPREGRQEVRRQEACAEGGRRPPRREAGQAGRRREGHGRRRAERDLRGPPGDDGHGVSAQGRDFRAGRRRPAATTPAPTGAASPATDRSASLATALDGFSPTTVGVPNFFIDRFRIPPFLLPIYQAAGIQYGVRWEVLAAINEIETDYGRNLNVSSAGALGWMQFMPATWQPTASTPTRTASATPSTRSTRSSPPRATSRPPAPSRTSARPSGPTTTPTGTSTPSSSAPSSSPPSRPTSSPRCPG